MHLCAIWGGKISLLASQMVMVGEQFGDLTGSQQRRKSFLPSTPLDLVCCLSSRLDREAAMCASPRCA